MAKHTARTSPPPITYTARPAVHGPAMKCTRCARVYAYPLPGAPAIRCECGWRYTNNNGMIEEEFKPRIGV
jgi:hypothetical protein